MQLKKILVAHDFSEPANRALELAASIAAKAGATVEVAHVHQSDLYDGGDPAAGGPWPSAEQLDRYLRFLDQELERTVSSVLGSEQVAHVTRHVLRGDPVKRIEALAGDLKADLICVASTGKDAVQRVLLGSVSQSILRSSTVPVLTVH